MKILCVCAALLLTAVYLQAEVITGTTGDGKGVLLNSNGTWTYNTGAKSSVVLFDTVNDHFKIYIDTNKWKQEKSDEANKMTFDRVKGDAYAMIFAERIGGMSLDSLKAMAVKNASAVATDMKVSKEEVKTINGKKVLYMQMDGIIQGIPFTYYGYYYAGQEGTLQVITYTSQNLFKEYEKDLKEVLDGTRIVE